MIKVSDTQITIDTTIFACDMFWYDDESEAIEKVVIESVICDRDDNIAVMVIGEESLLMELSWDLLAMTPEDAVKPYLESDQEYIKLNAQDALKAYFEKEDTDADS